MLDPYLDEHGCLWTSEAHYLLHTLYEASSHINLDVSTLVGARSRNDGRTFLKMRSRVGRYLNNQPEPEQQEPPKPDDRPMPGTLTIAADLAEQIAKALRKLAD